MYAVIESGGKQYRVQAGDILQVEKLEGEVGAPINFAEVLFVSKPSEEASQVWVGSPTLAGATVTTEIVAQGRGEKILLVKHKRRKNYRRTQGHRQFHTELLVTSIDNGSGDKTEISAEDKKTRIKMWNTSLAPKGPKSTPKTLGSRERARRAAGTSKKAAPKKTAEKQAAAPKKTAKKKKSTASATKKVTKKKAEK